MLPAQSAFNHPGLFQSWQPSGRPEGGEQQQAGFIELPVVSDYSQLRGHQAFNAIQTQFLNEVRELKQLAYAYVGQEYDKAIDTFVAKLRVPTRDLLTSLLPIYRETRFHIHQLVGRLKEYQQGSAGDQQSLSIRDYIASVLHDCLEGIDLCPAGVHSRFSRSFFDLEAIVHGGLAGTFYKLKNDLFREFIQAFLWQNQREGKISIARSMEVHWFNALYNLYCNNLALPLIVDPRATTNFPDGLLSCFLQRVPVSVNVCTILRRMVDSWCTQIAEALAAVGCSHWLNGPTNSNENTAIGIDALISRVFNPVNSLIDTATDNPLNLDAVMDLCDSESFHLKRHREKMLAWITGHLYPKSTTVFAEVLVCGRAKAYIGSINELFFWVFDHDQSLRPGQTCGFTADQHTSLKLTHLLSIDFSSWPVSTGHALLTQAMEQTDEPDEIVAFFLDCNVTTQLNAMSQPVSQALSNQFRDKLQHCTSAFRDVLCQEVCSYLTRYGIKTVSGQTLGWLIDTPLLEPVLLGLSRQRIDISRVVKGLDSRQISNWSRQCLHELLAPDDCVRLFRQALDRRQASLLAFLLLTGHCDLLACPLGNYSLNKRGLAPRYRESLMGVFARHGELAGLQYLLSLLQQNVFFPKMPHLAQVIEIRRSCGCGLTPLMKAARYGHADCLQELLNVPGIDVNVTSRVDYTPLHLAVAHSHVQCVRVLLQTGSVAVNRKEISGMTPLICAVVKGCLDIVRMLLAHTNIAVNEACSYGFTSLHYAARDGHTEIMQALLAMPGIDVNAESNGGSTPLNAAAIRGFTGCVQALLAVPGIDANASDKNGWTPLNNAASNGFTSCVRALLNVPGILVNKADSDGYSPLSSAIEGGRSDCVRLLSAAPGVDVNQIFSDGRTPLLCAIASGHMETVRAILAAKNVLVNAAPSGMTALYYAAIDFDRADMVRELLQTPGILVNARQGVDQNPLIAAAEKGHWQCLRELLGASGADVNQVDNGGWTPLTAAARYARLQCLRLLLQAPGIEVNRPGVRPNAPGWTPLHYATHWQYWECVQVLSQATDIQVNLLTSDGHFALGMAAERGDLPSLRALLAVPGIEINKSGPSGNTALHLAALNGHAQCIEALLQVSGIDPDSRNRFRQSPLDLAIQEEFRECIELLQLSSFDQ